MNRLRLSLVTRSVLAAFLVHCVGALASGAEPRTDPTLHPLDPVIAWAEKSLAKSNEINDYTALLTKRERVAGHLQGYQYLQLKVRHEPFSVYARFLKPLAISGRETLYVEGQNNGLLLAHEGRGLGEAVGTVSLAPEGMIAMSGQRHPLTRIGFKNLARRLLAVAKQDRQIAAPCDVKFIKGAKVNGRTTTCIQVSHPIRHAEHQFSMARVFIDEQLGIPIRYEGYAWPEQPGEDQVLVEEYTYSNIQPNVGLTDRDFDPKNPAYDFN